MPAKPSPALLKKLKAVKLFLCDVDGVLTDGAVYMGNGVETKRFNIRDGLGLKFLQRHGIQVGWVSRRPSSATQQRADDLKIDFVVQHNGGKIEGVESILRQTGKDWRDVCYVGDDVVDIAVLNRVGLAVVPGDGTADTKEFADYITKAAGGHGAIREIVEMILKAQNKWKRVIAEYAN
ncbi:MAG TPA: HAD hydrolase family protein [Verrucomicrobiae bacterium]|nr:HAD hydrolase family protein [Verrucomicrobiae bacterium]